MLTPEQFLGALARFKELAGRAPTPELARWLEFAVGVTRWRTVRPWDPEAIVGPEAFLVSEVTGADGPEKLGRMKWCVAAEVLPAAELERARDKIPARVRPFADALKRACARCGAPAIVVAHEYSDNGYDPSWRAELLALCTGAPHVSSLATSPWGFLSLAD